MGWWAFRGMQSTVPPLVLPWDLGLGKYKAASLDEVCGSMGEGEMDVWYAAVRGMPWG